MPRVEFVNLSLNRLSGPVEPPVECNLRQIRNLVLNNTRSDWESVEAIISLLPSLEELHLSLNEYTEVLIDTLDDNVVFLDDNDEANNGEDVQLLGAASTTEVNVCTCDRTTKRSMLP